MNKLNERSEAIIRGEAPPAPVAKWSGLIWFRLNGQGGDWVADAAMGIAYASNLNEGESFISLHKSHNSANLIHLLW